MEFDLIHRYFTTPFAPLAQAKRNTVLAGIGDDCAALQPTAGHVLYVSTDTLVAGIHFFEDDEASLVGWKSLACNLSDLAACGATPLGFTLNLSLPSVDHGWLTGFSEGLLAIASQYDCPLVGGDTTSARANAGVTLSITVFGQAPAGHHGFHRALAQVGDDIWVSGTPGLARLGLLIEYDHRDRLAQCCSPSQLPEIQHLLAALPNDIKQLAVQALQRPQPRIQLGQQLRGLANASVDLSDGLAGDLAHIAKASQLRAELFESSIDAIWNARLNAFSSRSESERQGSTWLNTTLQGGDDFELCWTAHSKHRDAIQSLNASAQLVGTMQAGEGVWLRQSGGAVVPVNNQSFNHFPGSDQ